MRTRVVRRVILVGGALAVLGGAVSAHHSFAMYEMEKRVTLKGTVKAFRWINPHALIVLTVDGAPPIDWSIEMSSTGNMTRHGWSRSTLSVGDAVEVVVSPLRDGSPGAACHNVRRGDSAVPLDCNAGAAIRTGETPNLPER